MRKAFVLAAVSAAAVLSAATAHAAIYTVHVDGQLIQQLTEGSDPRFAIGTPITFDVTFNSSRLVTWGDSGYQVGFLWNNSAYDLNVAGNHLGSTADYLDGIEAFTIDTHIQTSSGLISDLQIFRGRTDIIFYNGEVVGLTGGLVAVGNNPGVNLGGAVTGGVNIRNEYVDGPVTTTGSFAYPLSGHDTFTIGDFSHYYSNTYTGPMYRGEWDFDNARVAIDPVPEPAAWALMIVGFGLAGSAIRRRRAHAAAA